MNFTDQVDVEIGDSIIIKTPGGGGFGNPAERDPQLLADDIITQIVCHQQAIGCLSCIVWKLI